VRIVRAWTLRRNAVRGSGLPVELGARALEILIVLLSRPNEVVSKKDLLARLGPNVAAEESNLRFHIASLRKALGDRKDGRTVYRDSAWAKLLLRGAGLPLGRPEPRIYGGCRKLSARQPAQPLDPDGRARRRCSQAVGSAGCCALYRHRGAGGVGKTTVAVAVGHHLIEAFARAVLFVDLGMLSSASLVATAVASMVGLSVQFEDATPSLIA